MKYSNKVLVVVFFITLACFQCFYGLSQNPRHTVYDTSNGLVSDEVYDVEIASNGLIWLTTDRGVQSFDGSHFTNYSMKDGLRDNVNFEIFKDKNGAFWFNGFNGEVSILSDDNFFAFENNSQVLKFLKDNAYSWLSNIIIDDEGLLIAGEGSQTPQLFSFTNDQFNTVGDVKTNTIQGEKFVYIEVGNHIFSYYNRFQKSTLFLYNKVSTINYNRKIINNDFSILIKTGQTQKVIKFADRIEFINNEEESKIWIGTRNGIYSIDLLNNYEVKHYFENLHVTSITRDIEGSYWISTIESGLYWVPSFDFGTVNLSAFTSKHERILSLGVLGKQLLAGTSGGKLIAIDSFYKSNLVTQSLVNKDQITKLAPINDKTLNSGFGNISIRNKQFQVDHSNMLPMSYQYKDKYIIQYGSKGFTIINDDAEICSSFSFEKPITSKITSTMVFDDFFLTGSHSGLFITEGSNFLQSKEVKHNGKSIGRISQIIPDEQGNTIILTMANGIYIFKNNKLEILKSKGQIHFINDGVFVGETLWLATNKGLIKQGLSYSDNKFEVLKTKRYTIADGLISNYINNVTIWRKQLWLATNKGLCFFDVNKEDFKPAEIPLSIGQVLVNDSVLIDNNARLAYFQNNLNFTFQGMSMKKEWIKPFFKFRLEKNGALAEWRNTNLNKIQFENLGPGSYKLEVKAQNAAQTWNESSETFEFVIDAHYTDQLWFKSTIILSLLSLVVLYFLRLLRKNKERFLLREKIKQIELDARESELALLRNQMNPHFLFNALNSIQNLIFKNEEEKASQYISTFGALIRKTLDFTKHRYITLEEELSFITKYLELERMRFPEKFNFSISKEDCLDLNKLQIPPLLLQPIVENSIVHGFKSISYIGQITIKISEVNLDEFCITLSDNGKGLTTKQINHPHNSIGLSLLQDRLNLINQSIGNNSTSITFDGSDGMKVIIKLPKTIS